jgi:hypothetical protein
MISYLGISALLSGRCGPESAVLVQSSYSCTRLGDPAACGPKPLRGCDFSREPFPTSDAQKYLAEGEK